jgi:flavin reductase (DIM6/NTAB) family NADH-FMN oxidoreductase RutF
VLADTQRSLLARFGKPATAGDDPFAGLPLGRSTCGAATLGDAAAWLECAPVAQTSGTDTDRCDHVVVLARVTAAGAGTDLTPLVHLRKNGLRY